jgi:hypothetical protein
MAAESSEAVAEDGTERGSRTGRPAEKGTRGRHFSMAVVNFWLDALLLVLLVLYGWATTMLRVVFPAPTAATGWSLWGWTFDQWWDFQFEVLCALALAVLVHLMLHWNWICSVVASQILRTRRRPDDSMQTIYGVATLIVILHLIAAGIIAALYCVHRPPL